jgi:FtsH-binding integral membrane protein
MNSFSLEKLKENQIALIQKVYLWMFAALLITAGTAYRIASSELLISIIFSSKISFWILIIAQFAIVWYLTSRLHTMSLAKATIMFSIYSILLGITLSVIFLLYTASSIAGTFVVTSFTFGIMSAYGYFTKKDLSSWGNILFMGILGIIISTLVNVFLQSSIFQLIISAVGVLIFVGLTAYDTQKIKDMLQNVDDVEQSQKLALIGALMLYLDFINLFLYLIRLIGDRK